MYDTNISLMKFNVSIAIVGIDDLKSSLVHNYMYLCAFRWKIIQILVPNPVSFFFSLLNFIFNLQNIVLNLSRNPCLIIFVIFVSYYHDNTFLNSVENYKETEVAIIWCTLIVHLSKRIQLLFI